MAKVNVKKAFSYTRADGRVYPVKEGEQDIPDEDAENPYVKAHLVDAEIPTPPAGSYEAETGTYGSMHIQRAVSDISDEEAQAVENDKAEVAGMLAERAAARREDYNKRLDHERDKAEEKYGRGFQPGERPMVEQPVDLSQVKDGKSADSPKRVVDPDDTHTEPTSTAATPNVDDSEETASTKRAVLAKNLNAEKK